MTSVVVEAAKFASFLLFLALGIRVARSKDPNRMRTISVFIGFVIVVHLFSGFTQLDNWPFPNHAVAVGRGHDGLRLPRFALYGVDAKGREWPLDSESFAPVFETILHYWLTSRYPALSPADQRAAEVFLLERAEAARRATRAGKRIGFAARIGPLHLPYWFLLPPVRDVSAEPYVRIRFYRRWFVPREIERNPTAFQPELIEEWSR